jgi:hypothetical protein
MNPLLNETQLLNVRVLDGVSFPLSRQGLDAALTSLPSAGGCVIQAPNCRFTFESAQPVYIQSDNVAVIGHPSSVIGGPAFGDCAMICPYGERGPGVRLRRSATRYETSVALSGGLPLAAGDTILIKDLSNQHSHITVITDVTPTAELQFADPLSDPFPAASTEVYKLTMRRNLCVQLWLDGSESTGSVIGFGANYAQYGRFDITATNFASQNSYGAYDNYGYGNSWLGLFLNCGNVNNALGYSSSAFEVLHCTRNTVRDVHIGGSKGFGFSTYFTNHSLFDNVNTSYTRGHGIKIGGSSDGSQCADCRVSNCAVSYVGIEPSSGTGESGICYTAGSHDIIETNCRVQNCSWHGWEVYGDAVHRIFSSNLHAYRNGLVNPGASIATFGYGLVFNGAVYDTCFDRAIGTLWDGAFSPAVTEVASTDAETVVYSKTIARDTMGKNRALRLFVSGRFYNATGAEQRFAVTLKFGAIALISTRTPPIPSAGQQRPFVLEALVKNAGSEDVQSATMILRVGAGRANDGEMLPDLINATLHQNGAAVDTTQHQELVVQIRLSKSDTSLQFWPDACQLQMIG